MTEGKQRKGRWELCRSAGAESWLLMLTTSWSGRAKQNPRFQQCGRQKDGWSQRVA